MSEEENENENENNEEEEKEDEGEGEGEENEDEGGEGEVEGEGEGEDENNEEEEKEDEGEGEENEDNEGEEKEDDEENDDEENNKKKKKNVKKNEEKVENGGEVVQVKFPETKLSPTREIKMDLNLNLNNFNMNNSSNIFFNGNDITMANIIPKKSTLQLLMEISSEMDMLTSHLEKVLPSSSTRFNIDYKIVNDIPNQLYSPSPISNFDQEDLEIKKLINKANEMTNNSILNKRNYEVNNSINNNNNEVKIFEDKGCQSDDEYESSFRNPQNENSRMQYDYNNNRNGNFPYDPYKHLDYYNDLRNNNNGYNYDDRTKRMDNFYNRSRPVVYSQPESSNVRSMRNLNYPRINTENNNREMPFQRYKPRNIDHAMDILLGKK